MIDAKQRRDLAWSALPAGAQLYVAAVIAGGVAAAATFLPTRIDHPFIFVALLGFAYLTSTWKVNLPLELSNGSTLSVSYAADLMSLLLLGPRPAMLIAMLGAWAQCERRPKKAYPFYRTIFSIAVLAMTMRAVAAVYVWLGGGVPSLSFVDLPKPLVGMIATYFVINTGLVAAAIALANRQPLWMVWRDNFLWSAPSFMVAGGAGALAAVVIARGDYWLAPLMAAPVYLTYWTYRVFLGRLEGERALAAEKERLAVTLRSVGDGVIATDTNGSIQLLNRAAEVLTGWTQDEAVGKSLAEVIRHADPDTGERYDHSMRSRTLVTRDGRQLPVEEVWAPLRAADGGTIGRVLAFRDASDAIKIQEERAKASKLESLGLLAGGIAHDFNNILTAILGNVSIARSISSANPQADNALDEAERACVRARQLTQQLLTFAKGGAPVKKPLQLERIIQESARLALSGSNVSWAAEIAPNLWPVNADEGQLIQVFNNVIINAQQAMPEGGRVLITATNVTEPAERWEYGLRAPAGPYVRISIKDEGVGIPESEMPKIFEPYYSTKRTGSGLGLATSHSIVKNHGGYIAIDSQVGRGTTVDVSLPAAVGHEIEEASPPLEAERGGTGRVLVLDDEAQIRNLATQLLQLLGYDAETVSSGGAAIERYTHAREQGRPFDLVMLDLTIPGGMGGGEVIRVLSQIDPDVKAVVVSGYANNTIMANYRDYGFKAVVTKPFTLPELRSALHDVAK